MCYGRLHIRCEAPCIISSTACCHDACQSLTCSFLFMMACYIGTGGRSRCYHSPVLMGSSDIPLSVAGLRELWRGGSVAVCVILRPR